MKERSITTPINQEEIAQYLKDIRKIKVMTPDREKELAKLINSGNLTNEEREMINKEVLEGNLRFVITIAKQYQNQGLELSDLIAEGNLGLLKAINKFDWSKNIRFISYAVNWVRQTILQSLNETSRTIRLPVNVVQDLYKEKKRIENSNDEIDDKFATLPSIMKLDMSINDEGDSLIDIITNPNALLPDYSFNTQDVLKQRLFECMNVLDEREKAIIDDYYGLSGTSRTLEDIGSDFNLTKERVRQLKERGLKKLRNEAHELFEYF